MRRSLIIVVTIFLLFLMALILFFLNVKTNFQIWAEDYKIISIENLQPDLCPENYNKGLKVVAFDEETKNILAYSYGWVTTSKSAEKLKPNDAECLRDDGTEFAEVRIYSSGHAPSVFKLKMPNNKLFAVGVPLKKSCEEEKYDSINEDLYFEKISDNFGLLKEDYKLRCMEALPYRGGLIKATGLYLNSIDFVLFYHWGWCALGGMDCGYTLCFSTNNDNLFDSVKEYSCQRLPNQEYIEKCKNGNFDSMNGNKKTLSFVFSLNQEISNISKGEANCLEF